MFYKISAALIGGGVATTLAAQATDAQQRDTIQMVFWVGAVLLGVIWGGTQFYYYKRVSWAFIMVSLAMIVSGVMTTLTAKEDDATKRQTYTIVYWVLAVCVAAVVWYKSRSVRTNLGGDGSFGLYDQNPDVEAVNGFTNAENYYFAFLQHVNKVKSGNFFGEDDVKEIMRTARIAADADPLFKPYIAESMASINRTIETVVPVNLALDFENMYVKLATNRLDY